MSLRRSITDVSAIMRTNPEALKALLRASAWLTGSGIQETETEHAGGFYAYYSSMDRSYSYLYSEITGYAISTLLYLDRILPFMSRDVYADFAASWLVDQAWVPDQGGFIAKFFPTQNKVLRQIYTFDTGMILNGMVNLYQETGNSYYLSVAAGAVEFIVDRMRSSNGMPYPIFDLDTNEFVCDTKHWSTDIQPYLGKCAIGLLNYADTTMSDRVRDYASQMLEWVHSWAQEHVEGAASHGDGAFHLHPTCYAIEALLVGGVNLEREHMIQSALKTWKFVAENQLPNGGFPMLVGSGENFERSDICAQFIRTGYILNKLGMLPDNYGDALDRAVTRLVSLSSDEPDPKSYGAIMHSGRERPERYDPNCWCTMFAIQALALAAGLTESLSLMVADMFMV